MKTFSDFGFRVLDSAYNKRILIEWPQAFSAYANCDLRAEVHRPAYLSAYQFPEEFKKYLQINDGSTRGYTGPTWSRWLWFDVDNKDAPAEALAHTRMLIEFLGDRYRLADDMLVFFSGGKGFHVGLPTSLWVPDPSESFASACRQFAEAVARQAGIVIDLSIYDRVRLFRAPNSWHVKGECFKRYLTLDELFDLDVDEIRNLAAEPAPFEIPVDPPLDEQAVADWKIACESVAAAKVARPSGTVPDQLNHITRDFLIDGAEAGDRHRLLYSASRNLGDFGCSFELALALLEPPARESGLLPSDIRRQIECGIADSRKKGIAQ